MTTQMTSKIGKPSTKKAVASFPPDITLSTASIKPKNILPESPKKILAGLKFQGMKPKTAPLKIIANKAAAGCNKDKLKTKTLANPETPLARQACPHLLR